jgi:hypothetical protein
MFRIIGVVAALLAIAFFGLNECQTYAEKTHMEIALSMERQQMVEELTDIFREVISDITLTQEACQFVNGLSSFKINLLNAVQYFIGSHTMKIIAPHIVNAPEICRKLNMDIHATGK